MQSQIIFKAEDTLKKAMMEKIKKDNITLRLFFTSCMQEYLNGKLSIGVNYNTNSMTSNDKEFDKHLDKTLRSEKVKNALIELGNAV